jgi:hypothetical protein
MDTPIIICNGKVEISEINHLKKNIKCQVKFLGPVPTNLIPETKQYVSKISIVAAEYLQYEGFIPYCNKFNEWTIDSVGVYKENDFQE